MSLLSSTGGLGLPRDACERLPNHQFNGTRLSVYRDVSLEACCNACTHARACGSFNWHPPGDAGQATFCELQAGGGAPVPSSPARNFSAGRVTAHRVRLLDGGALCCVEVLLQLLSLHARSLLLSPSLAS